MISRLQLNLRSDSICSPHTSPSELPSASALPIDTKLRENRFDSHGTFTTISTLSHYFDVTVTELGRDMVTPELADRRNEASLGIAESCSCAVRCLGHAFHAHPAEAEVEFEMAPIRPVSGGALISVEASYFSPEESEWLDTVIQVSPAIVEDRRSEEGK
jgi:hypothetical protein